MFRLLLLCAALLACQRSDPKLTVAEFGVFYGEEIQERREIPFVVDATKQQQGFRILLGEPAKAPIEVRWELARPGPTRSEGTGNPDARVTELGVAVLPPGERRFEQRFPLKAGDPLGLWNIRVTVGQELAIDRAFTVFDRAARRRAKQRTRTPDAGR
jgi:hypothetical protein